MRIGEAANRAGVGVETVRFYEQKGLIDQPVKPQNGGYREYTRQQVRHIRFIRRAQRLGFTLSEIVELLTLKTGKNAQCVDVQKRASTKLKEVNSRLQNLEKIKTTLETLIESCPGRGPAHDCSILEAITNGDLQLDNTFKGD